MSDGERRDFYHDAYSRVTITYRRRIEQACQSDIDSVRKNDIPPLTDPPEFVVILRNKEVVWVQVYNVCLFSSNQPAINPLHETLFRKICNQFTEEISWSIGQLPKRELRTHGMTFFC